MLNKHDKILSKQKTLLCHLWIHRCDEKQQDLVDGGGVVIGWDIVHVIM